MRAWTSVAAVAAAMGLFCGDARAANPVVVEYAAPPECASSEAFHALLSAQLAQSNNPDRPWRFSISIRRENDYVGVLKTEAGSRELRAPTCDEVTAALSLVIAMAQPELPAPPPQDLPPPPPVVAPPPMPMPTPTTMVAPIALGPPPAPREVAPQKETSALAWRVGARAEHWSDGSQIGFNGAFLSVGVEVPWGFPKMHFEVGLGALYFQNDAPQSVMPNGPIATDPSYVMLGLIDTQACPIDLPIASTGIDVMGCARVAFGLTKGILTNGDYGEGGWVGGGARLRWQSPWHVFVDAHFSGLYGTRVEGVPALMDFGGSVGLRI